MHNFIQHTLLTFIKIKELKKGNNYLKPHIIGIKSKSPIINPKLTYK